MIFNGENNYYHRQEEQGNRWNKQNSNSALFRLDYNETSRKFNAIIV